MTKKDRREKIETRTVDLLHAWAALGVCVRLLSTVAIIVLVTWACIQVVQLAGFLAIAIAP